MKSKKALQLKKTMKRLSKATEYVICCRDEDGCTYQTSIPSRRVLPGAEMRRLVKRCYKTLDRQGDGWLFWDRPKFRDSRKYCLSHYDDRDTLCVSRWESWQKRFDKDVSER